MSVGNLSGFWFQNAVFIFYIQVQKFWKNYINWHLASEWQHWNWNKTLKMWVKWGLSTLIEGFSQNCSINQDDDVECFGSWAVHFLLHTLFFPSFLILWVQRILFQKYVCFFRCCWQSLIWPFCSWALLVICTLLWSHCIYSHKATVLLEYYSP